MNNRSIHRLRSFAVASAALLATHTASSQVTFNLSTVFSGSPPPDATPPWATAQFADQGGGVVRLTLSVAADLPSDEFIGSWYFNFNPDLDVDDLAFASVSTAAATYSFATDTDGHKADGDGKYDILVDFGSAAASRFTPGETMIWDITSSAGAIQPGDFNFLSAPDGGHGPFVTAAHVQGIPGGGAGSAWVTVPEPSTYAAIIAALTLGIVVLRRRRGGRA
jgi:hypothetical protein